MIKTAKFNIPVSMLTEFIDFINSQGLKGTILSKKDDMYNIEIPDTKEQSYIIKGMTELVGVFTTLALVSLSVLSSLAAAAQNSQAKKPAPAKAVNKKYCFFKDFVTQNVKK